MSIGLEIKRIRLLNDLSVAKIANMIGVDAGRLRKWEEKGLNPKQDDQILIEDFFKVPISELDKIHRITYSSKNVPHETKTKETTQQKQFGETAELLIELQAKIDVILVTVEHLSASASKNAVSLVSAQMNEAIELRKKQLWNEWK